MAAMKTDQDLGTTSTGAVRKVSGAKDGSGMEIFVETILPEIDLKKNTLGNILGETPSDWHSLIFHKPIIPLQLFFEATYLMGSLFRG